MPRRNRFVRALGALMALWVSVVQMEPAALHVCAMHSPQPVTTAAATAAAPAMDHSAGHHHAAAPASAGANEMAAASSRSHGSHEKSPGRCCTCPDSCAVTGAVIVAAAPELVIPAARAEAPRVPAPRDDVRPASAVRLLPFANGPPQLV